MLSGLLGSCLLPGAAAAELHDVPAASAVLQRGDHTLLTWRDGPPYLTVPKTVEEPWARYSSDRRVLRLETGWYALDFDTERVAISGYARFVRPRADSTASSSALGAAPLPPAQLRLAIDVGGETYTCIGRRSVSIDGRGEPSQPMDFPVRVLESGRFLQKIALYDLEFVDAAGRRFDGVVHLELVAWPNRLAVTLAVAPARSIPVARASVGLQTYGGVDARIAEEPSAWEAGKEHRTTLTMSGGAEAISPSPTLGIVVEVKTLEGASAAVTRWNSEELCHDVRVEAVRWPAAENGPYPEGMLDRWERYAVTLENRSDQPQTVALKFDHSVTKMLTGCVPLLLDGHGDPTGIPVQTSKNWHRGRGGEQIQYMGPWLHGCAWLHVAPRSRLQLQYALVYARWGGVPAASLAQLSLVGWGHNGFWDEFALGSFGESFCFQPLRVQRRSLITDFRPLYQLGMVKGTPLTWTTNVGGGDTMVRYDPSGRYVPFKRHVSRYVSYGPNLAQLDYSELSADDAVLSNVTVGLPRTDDGVRVYLHIRYEVRRHLEFSRLVLFQLGADFYSDTVSPKVAWGDARGLAAEHEPGPADELPRWVAGGDAPWISLHGQPRVDLSPVGQGTRGVVVRAWQAILGGRSIAAPTVAVARGLPPKHPLRAEIVPPQGLRALEPGDQVDMVVEVLALPLSADRYYGPDDGLRAALVAGANTWKPVYREAAENRPTVAIDGVPGAVGGDIPLVVPFAERNAGRGSVRLAPQEARFTLEGGLGWVPVRLAGLPRPDAIELWRETQNGMERVVQGPPGRPFWQADYDASAATWSLTYNLPATPERVIYLARLPSATTIPVP